MSYTIFGPFADGGAPGISAEFINPVETFLASINSAATDANISANGSGLLTLIGLVFGTGGKIQMPNPSAQALTNGNTISIPGPFIKVTTAGNVTGIILTAGSVTNQIILLYQSSSAGTVTFAASGSNVRNGSNVILGVGRLYLAVWDGSSWGFTSN